MCTPTARSTATNPMRNRREIVRACGERGPRRDEHGEETCGELVWPRSAARPGEVRGECTGHPGEADQADLCVAEAVRFAGQQERHRREQDRDRSERHRAERGCATADACAQGCRATAMWSRNPADVVGQNSAGSATTRPRRRSARPPRPGTRSSSRRVRRAPRRRCAPTGCPAAARSSRSRRPGRCAPVASAAANGTRTCAATENRPVTAIPAVRTLMPGAEAAGPIRPAAARIINPTASRRCEVEYMSPSGTRNSRPRA